MSVVADKLTDQGLWEPHETAAWKRPEPLTPSAWAERHRHLSREQSDRYGPLRHANAPYLAGIMDLCDSSRLGELWIEKPTQIGVSEAIRSVLAYWAEREPDPVLLVLPDEKKGREVIADRIIPLFNETPVLRRLHTGIKRDLKLSEIRLRNGFVLRLGYSGSASTLQTHPARRVLNDEVDFFQPYSGRAADPVSEAKQRVKSYGDRAVIINISRPITADGLIHTGRTACAVQLRYWVPCPHCGHWQVLHFANLRYAAAEENESQTDHAERIAAQRLAWYECEQCTERITERQKPGIVRRGVWATEAAVRREDFSQMAARAPLGGVVWSDWPIGRTVGLHITELPCLWASFWDTAAAWIKARGDRGALMMFRNGRLGEPAREQIFHAKPSVFQEKCRVVWPAGELPDWAQRVLISVDVQVDHCYVVVRAWGYQLQSRRIWHGILPLPKASPDGWNELERFGLQTIWPFADKGRPGLAAEMIGVDEKYRPDEVLTFSLRNPVRIKAMAGVAKPLSQLVWRKPHVYNPPDSRRRRPIRAWLHLMDTERLKDWLAGAILGKMGRPDPKTGELLEEELWQLNSVDDPVYNRQMAAEHKVPVGKGTARRVDRWVKIGEGAPNHYWDCEYMQRALAFLANVELLRPLRVQAPQAASRPPPEERPRRRPPIRRHYD